MHGPSAQHVEQHCLAGGSSGISVQPCHLYKVHMVNAAVPAEQATQVCFVCAARPGKAASMQVC